MKKIIIIGDDNLPKEYVPIAGLHPVAFNGDYNTLINKPVINNNLGGKPTIATINDNIPQYTINNVNRNGLIRCLNKKNFKIIIPIDSAIPDISICDTIAIAAFDIGVGEIIAASGVTIINEHNEFKISKRGATVTLFKTAANEYLLVGSTSK